jgi:glutamate synthase domain-containing protein 3
MSGGIAYVLDEEGDFGRARCNLDMVDLESFANTEEECFVRTLIERHADATGSNRAKTILDRWDHYRGLFVKIMPLEYRRVLEAAAAQKLAKVV